MFTTGKFIVLQRGQRIKDFIDHNGESGSNWVTVVYSMPGQVVFNIGETVPVIAEGYGCIGVGTPVSLYITGTRTEIEFKYYERKNSDDLAQALYKYYQMQGGVSSDNKASGSGFVLPGLAGVPGADQKSKGRGRDDDDRGMFTPKKDIYSGW